MSAPTDRRLEYRRAHSERALVAALVTAWLAAGFREIRLSDVPGFIARAFYFDVTSLESLVDPFYPCGYPMALRVLGEPMADYHRAAQVLSLAGGALTLAAVWVIGRVGFDWDVACAATLLVGTHYEFNLWAIAGTTDSPALGWTYASVERSWSTLRAAYACMGPGGRSLVGIGYLVRYSSLTTVPAGILIDLTRRSLSFRDTAESRGRVPGGLPARQCAAADSHST